MTNGRVASQQGIHDIVLATSSIIEGQKLLYDGQKLSPNIYEGPTYNECDSVT